MSHFVFSPKGPAQNSSHLLILHFTFYFIMHIHYGYNELKFFNPVVTMGTFDGVHRGHKLVINRLVERAKSINGESVVITFFPHPKQVLNAGKHSLKLLTTLHEKTDLLKKCGIDHLVIIEFDKGFSNKAACDFVEDILIGRIGAKELIIGFNHHFGKRREGNYDTIKRCAAKHNLLVSMVKAELTGITPVSSSSIRNALIAGNLEEANKMLGYNYYIEGKIVEGKKLGRQIGYPTANVSVNDNEKLIPGNGVYAVEVLLQKRVYKGVMSIGVNPTIDKNSSVRTIEVNIFRFRKEIYGLDVKVIFRFRLRDEMIFESLSDLASQIAIDKKRALELLD